MKIKLGGTRIVLVFKNIVVKMPLPISFKNLNFGIASNYNEAITWITSSESKRRLLCPVYFNFCGLVLIQKRLYEVNDEHFKKVSYIQAEYMIRKTGIPTKEFTKCNTGVDADGSIRLIDYGLTLPAHDRGGFYRKYKSYRNKINRV